MRDHVIVDDYVEKSLNLTAPILKTTLTPKRTI